MSDDLIRQLLHRHETQCRSLGRNPLDYGSKWKQAADTIAELPAAQPTVTVQDAARVLLGCDELSQIGSMPIIRATAAVNATEDWGPPCQGDVLGAIRAALRALAEGGK